ncbi:MAG TPA: UPF0147 family protein [Thermoplasmatales archaeon]|nr:UPF0147 family protein [Thermoplasmatales archaeon]
MNEEGLKTVLRMLEELANDISVPRNIRRGAKEAKEILMKKEDTLDVKVASAISLLDELLSDPNIPTHGRTAIWNIMSALESLTAS